MRRECAPYRRLGPQQREPIDRDVARFAFDRLALAREIVEPLALVVHRREHRRHLRDLADELRHRVFQLALPVGRQIPDCNRLAERVLRRRCAPEHNDCGVRLALIFEQWNQPGRFADRNGQHAGGLGIKRA